MDYTIDLAQNDMYRIYGVNKLDITSTQVSHIPKTSAGKRENATTSLRIDPAINPNARIKQKTSQGKRSVSPNNVFVSFGLVYTIIIANQC